MEQFMKTAKDISAVLENNNMKLNEMNGSVFLVNQAGIKIQLKSLFKAIGDTEDKN